VRAVALSEQPQACSDKTDFVVVSMVGFYRIRNDSFPFYLQSNKKNNIEKRYLPRLFIGELSSFSRICLYLVSSIQHIYWLSIGNA